MKGAVAGGHPLTAQAGARALAEGGNAVDACVAAAFASAVTESPLTGPGAGGFMLVHDARDGTTRLLDFFVAVPAGAHERRQVGRRMRSLHGPHQISLRTAAQQAGKPALTGHHCVDQRRASGSGCRSRRPKQAHQEHHELDRRQPALHQRPARGIAALPLLRGVQGRSGRGSRGAGTHGAQSRPVAFGCQLSLTFCMIDINVAWRSGVYEDLTVLCNGGDSARRARRAHSAWARLQPRIARV